MSTKSCPSRTTRKSFFKKRCFGLLEVIISFVIFAMVAVIVVESAGSSMNGVGSSYRDWKEEHLLSMGCEHYLLFGHESEFPGDLLPEGYRLDCILQEGIIPEDAEEEKYEPNNGWVIGEYTVKLYYQGEELSYMTVDKLVPAAVFE